MLKNLIYLDYHGNQPINLSDEAYEQIKALIETGKICKECSSHYDEHNPEMARNICLKCFLTPGRYPNYSSYTYIGPYTHESVYGTITTYYHYQLLMDTKGRIHKTSADNGWNDAKEDECLTMKHWGFQVPENVLHEGEITVLHDSEWSIHGDVHNPVIAGVNRHSRYHGGKDFVFLLYKDREALELNKRKGNTRDLFKEARKRVEATKDEKGHYRSFEGYEFCYEPHDSHLYAWIAQIEMEQVEARKYQAVQPALAKPATVKQEPGKQKERPAFGTAPWIQAAKEQMRPWELAIWKDVLEEEEEKIS